MKRRPGLVAVAGQFRRCRLGETAAQSEMRRLYQAAVGMETRPSTSWRPDTHLITQMGVRVALSREKLARDISSARAKSGSCSDAAHPPAAAASGAVAPISAAFADHDVPGRKISPIRLANGERMLEILRDFRAAFQISTIARDSARNQGLAEKSLRGRVSSDTTRRPIRF